MPKTCLSKKDKIFIFIGIMIFVGVVFFQYREFCCIHQEYEDAPYLVMGLGFSFLFFGLAKIKIRKFLLTFSSSMILFNLVLLIGLLWSQSEFTITGTPYLSALSLLSIPFSLLISFISNKLK